MSALSQQKDQLRHIARNQRKIAANRAGPGADRHFTDNLLSLASTLGVNASSVVAGYWAMSSELDITGAMTAMIEQFGATCLLPVVVGRDRPLIFREWQPGLALESGGFGTCHPPASSPERMPTVLMIPLLAFDEAGYRLGWGGGFYDRTLGGYRGLNQPVVAIGAAYAGQQMGRVAHDHLDQPVDWIVTENAVIQATIQTAARTGQP